MFKVLDEACSHTKGSKYSACIDLYSSQDITICAGETAIIGLGVEIDIKSLKKNMIDNKYFGQYVLGDDEFIKIGFNNFYKSHYIQLEPRSSLRAKGLIVGTGIIDLDYKDELKLIVHNPLRPLSKEEWIDGGDFKISKGDKIAQAMLCEHKSYLFGIESEDERIGGIGSTGN